MLIGELAERTGTSERLLRHYERAGLLRPERLPNGYRTYADSDAATVRRIRALLAAGLPTRVIRQVLPCTTGAAAVLPCPGVLDALRHQLRELSSARRARRGPRSAARDHRRCGEPGCGCRSAQERVTAAGHLKTGRPAGVKAPAMCMPALALEDVVGQLPCPVGEFDPLRRGLRPSLALAARQALDGERKFDVGA